MIGGADIFVRTANAKPKHEHEAHHFAPCGMWCLSPNLDDLDIALGFHQKNPTGGISQLPFHGIHRCIAAAQPHNFRWRSEELVPIGIVGILRHNHEAVILGVILNRQIIRFRESDETHMLAIWKQILQRLDEPMAEVLVKQQFHATPTTRW